MHFTGLYQIKLKAGDSNRQCDQSGLLNCLHAIGKKPFTGNLYIVPGSYCQPGFFFQGDQQHLHTHSHSNGAFTK
jgi:hypothetical protein